MRGRAFVLPGAGPVLEAEGEKGASGQQVALGHRLGHIPAPSRVADMNSKTGTASKGTPELQ